jgi:hypothetical protein
MRLATNRNARNAEQPGKKNGKPNEEDLLPHPCPNQREIVVRD